MVDQSRLWAALHKAQSELLAFRGSQDRWTGELASSPLATATATSALVLAEQHAHALGEEYLSKQLYQGDLSELLVDSLHWLAQRQNDDGGWGDADNSRSQLAATMLVRAAFHLTGVPARYADLQERADAYLERQGGIDGLRKQRGADRTFTALVLTNYALAGMAPWRKVPSMPFEWTCLPETWSRRLDLPLLGHAAPALVAAGQARFFHDKPLNPLTRLLRRLTWNPSYQLLERMLPPSGGWMDSIPLTSFVVMCLASSGHAESKVVRRGVEFLLANVRGDGSWPLHPNLATRNTALALQALADEPHAAQDAASVDWLLNSQQRESHGAAAALAGWSWTDQPGGLPNSDDTAEVLLTLAQRQDRAADDQHTRIDRAAQAGVEWLLRAQDQDGGWPRFCRDWGDFSSECSGTDFTAHALRALAAWRIKLPTSALRALPATAAADDRITALQRALRRFRGEPGRTPALPLSARIDAAIQNGLRYLLARQRPEGSWVPLGVGNQFLTGEANPVYGTSQVLRALQDLGYGASPPAQRARGWLASAQQADGGWGGGPAALEQGYATQASTLEETSHALEALAPASADPALQVAWEQGLAWLVDAIEHDRQHESTPLGFSWGKMWYHERLSPYLAAVFALHAAATRDAATIPQPANPTTHLSGA